MNAQLDRDALIKMIRKAFDKQPYCSLFPGTMKIPHRPAVRGQLNLETFADDLLTSIEEHMQSHARLSTG